MRIWSVLAALAVTVASSAWADFDAGQAAFKAERFDEALAEWRTAADSDDRRAMLALGRIHAWGIGVLQNYVEAHMWLNLAAARGEAAAAGERDTLTAKMTEDQVAEAQKRAVRWRPSLAVGDVFRDCAHCPEMVVVPSGSFMMGSPPSEEGRWDGEDPVHRVTIGARFAVGVYEVMRGEFGRFVSSTGRSMDGCWTLDVFEWNEDGSWRSPGFSQTDLHPAVCVSWEDARAYVDWLSGETGEAYRLLSEAEWEYVARAGTTTRYHWGDDIGWNLANCYSCGSRWDDKGTSPVGNFGANAFGLHDVHGNVWEDVEDCWNDSYAGAPLDGSAWKSGDCSSRVSRGGSWSNNPWNLRAAIRGSSPVTGDRGRHYNSGFRVARTFIP